MKSLLLHVGLHKTGTSSIQQAIVGRADDLAAAGWSAPGFLGRTDGAHHGWVKRLRERPDGIAQLVAALEALPSDRLLLSSEALAHWLLVPDQARALAAALRARFDTRVLIYLRRQDFLKESVYSQIVKTHFKGGIDSPRMYDLAFDRRLRTLEAAFGADNVQPRIYRDDRRFDAVEDFRVLLGLPETAAMAAASTRANVSMPRRKLLFLGEIAKKGRPAAEVRAMVEQVRVSDAIRDDRIKFLLSPQKRSRLVAKYAHGNAALCRRHGLEDDAAFLCDTTVSPLPWLPPEPITARERERMQAEIDAAVAALRASARRAPVAADPVP